MTKPLVINQWSKGIADSPHLGMGVMRNVFIDEYPGAVKAAYQPETWFSAAFAKTFTVDTGTEIVSLASSTTLTTGDSVTLTSTGTLPAGLSLATTYFVVVLSSTTVKLATTLALARASTPDTNITDAGTGVHTMTSTPVGSVTFLKKDPTTGYYYALDSNGRVWFNDGTYGHFFLVKGNTLTNANGNGMELFKIADGTKTYLFVFRNASIDHLEVTSEATVFAASWTNGFDTMDTGSGLNYRHEAIVGQDNIMYYTDSRYLGKITEAAGVFTGTSQVLDVPQGEVLVCLEELGSKLLAGGQNFNKIYPWDRTNDSFDLPLIVPEMGVYRMKNLGNVVYILAGSRGVIYKTPGTYVTEARKIPYYLSNNTENYSNGEVTWGGIAAKNGALIFGIGNLYNSAADGTYILYPDGTLLQDSTPVSGATIPTALLETGSGQYMVGYSGGVDTSSYSFGNLRYSAYEPVIQSPLSRIESATHKATFSDLEVQIAKPASSGNIRIGYRTNISSAFTTIATFSADGTSTSFSSEIGLIDIENIQIQIELSGYIELMEVTLIP